MRYILRHVVLSERWQTQLADLLALCDRAEIDEVMLMEQSHQVVTVPYRLEKHRAMAAIYDEYRRRLAERGIGFSINVATIVGHSDAPVPDDQVLPFQRFVGDDLIPARAVYCIASPAWVTYAEEVAAIYAATRPHRLMIDDDFRALNHTTVSGCYCELHAELTAAELGRDRLSSRELRDAVLGDSESDLVVRKAWLTVNGRAQLAAAHAIERAAHALDPEIQIGLMNSGEPSHSAQGRTMPELLRAFAGEARAILSRPAGGAYADCLHEDIVAMHQTSALSRVAADDAGAGYWVSEVENWPHSRFLKSVATTRLQMRLHALWGADALTLNLYDYLGTPFARETEWERLLVAERPVLEAIAAARAEKSLSGVALPWRGTEAALHRNRTHAPIRLLPSRRLDTLLPSLGIPVQFTPGTVSAVLGDDIRAYDEDEIRALLAGGLLIDHVAAQHLWALGFGGLLGGRVEGEIEGAVVERLIEPAFSGEYLGSDLPSDWFRLHQRGETIARWVPEGNARTISAYVDPSGVTVGAAVTVVENDLGGRVVVLAQSVHDLGWLHEGRAVQMRAVMRWLSDDDPALLIVDDGPNVAPIVYRDERNGSRLVALVNTGLDPVTVDATRLGLTRDLDGNTVDRWELAPLTLWVGV